MSCREGSVDNTSADFNRSALRSAVYVFWMSIVRRTKRLGWIGLDIRLERTEVRPSALYSGYSSHHKVLWPMAFLTLPAFFFWKVE